MKQRNLSKSSLDAIEILLCCGWTQAQVAQALRLTRSTVTKRAKMLHADSLPYMTYEAMSTLARVNASKQLIKLTKDEIDTDEKAASVAKRLMEVVHGYADLCDNLPLQEEILACERIMERLIKHGKHAALEDVQWCYDQLKKELK